MMLEPGSALPDDRLGEIVRQIVLDFDELPRPLLPFVRRHFELNVADAVHVLRVATVVAARHSQIEITDDADE